MRRVVLTLPALALVAATHGALGLGVGSLVSQRVDPARRRLFGWVLVAAGVAATIASARTVAGRRSVVAVMSD